MSTRILRWGILGAARISAVLLPPLAASPRNELLAIGSRDLAKAQRYAQDHGCERAYGSYEALLADPDVDVVYVPLPNHLHAEWAIRAAEAGKHVLCEKPLALTVADVDAIADAAAANRVVIAEAFMYRHHAQTLKVCGMIASGAIGELQLIRGGFTFPLNRPGDIRLKPETGGGSIWDVGCYPISFARAVAGGPRPTEVMGWQVLGPTGVDMSFFGQLRFANGVTAQFDSGFRSNLRMVMEFVGSEGTLTLTNAFKPDAASRMYLIHGDQLVQTLSLGEPDLYRAEVEDIYEAVANGKSPLVPLSDSRENIATICALIDSAQKGAPARLD